MKSLERLNVENNKIKYATFHLENEPLLLSKHLFFRHLSKSLGLHHATSLTSVNLSHNSLTSLPQFPPSLTELLLHSNQLSEIHAEVTLFFNSN